MFNIKEFEQEIESGTVMLRSVREGIVRDNLTIKVSKNLNLAGQYLSKLSIESGIPDDVFYCLARAFWNLGVAQGKIEQYKEQQHERLQDGKGEDND